MVGLHSNLDLSISVVGCLRCNSRVGDSTRRSRIVLFSLVVGGVVFFGPSFSSVVLVQMVEGSATDVASSRNACSGEVAGNLSAVPGFVGRSSY